MARPRRVWIPENFYHIVCRGNRRDPLYYNPADFRVFLSLLEELYEQYPYELTSYCLMTNHYHLQIRSQNIPFSKLMALLNKRYANYFNTKYGLTGHVFEKRYFDKAIIGRARMLEVSRYIHLNPVEAEMVKQPISYPWSSFHFYKNPKFDPPPYLKLMPLLDCYEGTESEKREKYCREHMLVPTR